ncbi:hypothetical protein SHIRM173S_08064 [Streptomyces hirsutus]
MSPVLRPATSSRPSPTPFSSRTRSRPVRRVTAMTAWPRITHNAPLPKGWPPVVSASTAHRTSEKAISIPIAAPTAMNRCRQVRTTIINAMAAYSRLPDLGANISSRTWLAIGPCRPWRRAANSSAMRNPRAATPATAQSLARGRRPTENAVLRFIRGKSRGGMYLNSWPLC